MKRDRAAVSSDASAEAIATEVLRTGNAVDAVCAGVMAAAASHSAMLFGSVQLIVGGGGVGLGAFDGRPVQPGAGAPRPRGFTSEQEIVRAARVAVPRLVPALYAAVATYGSLTWTEVTLPGAAALEANHPRRKLIGRIAQQGASALSERNVWPELEAVAGRLEGGLLTREDFETNAPTVSVPQMRTWRGGELHLTPWDASAERPTSIASTDAPLGWVVAGDRHGGFAVATFAATATGLDVPALGLTLPLFAIPVTRGTPRVRPGEPLPAPSPLALFRQGGVVRGAFASSREELFEAYVADASVSEAALGALDDAPSDVAVVQRADAVVTARRPAP